MNNDILERLICLKNMRTDVIRDAIIQKTHSCLKSKFMNFRNLEYEIFRGNYDRAFNHFILDESGRYIYDVNARFLFNPLCTVYLPINDDCYDEIVKKVIKWVQCVQPKFHNGIQTMISTYNSNIGVQLTVENIEQLNTLTSFIEENIIDSGICSVCNKDIIHSYRVHGANAGRATQIVAIV